MLKYLLYTQLNTSNLASVSEAKGLEATTGSGVYTLAVGFFRFKLFSSAGSAEVIASYAQSGSAYTATSVNVASASASGYIENQIWTKNVEAGTSDSSVTIKYRFHRC